MSRITLGPNISSLNAQRRVEESSFRLSKTFERLSSGQRINTASDDAAGLAIASALNTSQRVFNQGIRNLSDGQSLISIADSALGELSNIGTRLKELATQSANGTFSIKQRQTMNKEADALVKEYNRIIESTSFNGRKLLDNSDSSIRLQGGYGIDGGIGFSLGSETSRASGTGSIGDKVSDLFWGAPGSLLSVIGDPNNDGYSDLAFLDTQGGGSNKMGVLLSNGDGTFSDAISFDIITDAGFAIKSDFNNDGIDDVALAPQSSGEFMVLLGTGDGSIYQSGITVSIPSAGVLDSVTGDFDGDGNQDILYANSSFSLFLLQGNGDGTFSSARSISTSVNQTNLKTDDLNNDGISDILAFDPFTSIYYSRLGTTDGSFSGPVSVMNIANPSFLIEDLNRDGYKDIFYQGSDFTGYGVAFGNGDGTFGSPQLISSDEVNIISFNDINRDGIADLTGLAAEGVSLVRFGNGDGTFNQGVTDTAAALSIIGTFGDLTDFNGDGVSDFFAYNVLDGSADIHLSDTKNISTIEFMNISTQSGARDAMNTADSILDNINQERGKLGAVQSRIETATRNLLTAKLNYGAAESRIIDADIADESSKLIREQILQRTGAAVLAQANLLPELALRLLQ